MCSNVLYFHFYLISDRDSTDSNMRDHIHIVKNEVKNGITKGYEIGIIILLWDAFWFIYAISKLKIDG